MRPLDPRLLRHAQATRTFLVASVAVGTLTALLVVVQAFLIADGVVAVFQQGAQLADLTGTLIALAAIAAARAVLAWGSEAVGHRSAAAAISQLRQQVMGRALRSATPAPVAELATLVTRGADALDAYFARYLPQLVLAVLVPIVAGTAILTQDPLAAAIVALTVPLIPVFMVLIGRYTQARVDRQWSTLGVLSGYFLDLVAGLPTLKIFNRAQAQVQNLRTIGERYRAATMSVLRISFLSSLVLELLATLSVALIAVAIGLRLVEGTLDLRTGLVVLVLAPEVYLPLRMVGVHFHAAADGVAAAQRMFDLIESAPNETGAAAVHAPTAALRFTGLTVRYGDRLALADLTATIRSGRITALVGPSGCGKSTVLRVLLGEVQGPDVTVTGEVALIAPDGTCTPVQALDLTWWRAQLGWVPQQPSLIRGTVADNVRFDRVGFPDEDVAEALRAAGLPPASLSAGLATPVGDATGVSGGEARRIGLARALLGRPAILLLDEPSVAIDAGTEADVVSTLRRLREGGTTVLVVTHRTAVIEAADAVVALPAHQHSVVDPTADLAASAGASAGQAAR